MVGAGYWVPMTRSLTEMESVRLAFKMLNLNVFSMLVSFWLTVI